MPTTMMTVHVDATEFQAALDKALARLEAARQSEHSEAGVPVAAAVAGALVLAGSASKRVSRRSLLSLGFLR